MDMFLLSFFTVLALISSSSSLIDANISFTPLCKRIYVEHGKESEMPYVQLEGVYVKTVIKDNYLLFKREDREYFLQYSGGFFNALYFGHLTPFGKKEYVGVKANLKSSFNLTNWVNKTDGSEYPFEDVIISWYYFDWQKRIDVAVSKNKLRLRCVASDFHRCTSGRLYFNTTLTTGKNGTILHDHNTDYFEVLSDVFVNNRQVFQHNKQKSWYLFYHSSYWTVGPDYNYARGLLKVFDSPLRPEYILPNWEFWDGTKWVFFSTPVALRCRGQTRKYHNGTIKMCADNNPCKNQARCLDSWSTNETVCVCPKSYQGINCDQAVRKCYGYSSSSSIERVIYSDGLNGDIITAFCKSNSIPNFFFSQCRHNRMFRYWTAGSCMKKPTDWAQWAQWSSWSQWSQWLKWSEWSRWSQWSSWSHTRTRTKKRQPFNFDGHNWIRPVLLTVVCVLQVLIPLIHMLYFLCRYKSACRIISMHAYVTFVCWLTYYSACAYTKCTRYGQVLSDFSIMSIVMVVLSYLYMLIETCFSAEHEYVKNVLHNVSAIDYVARLKNANPVRVMMIECWHMETRFRTVIHTDGQGNTHSRVETYEEKVVTHTEKKVFPIGYARDISNHSGPKFDNQGVTRLKLALVIKFGDTETLEKFTEMKEKMLDDNKNRDVHVDFSYKDTIPGFKKRISAYVDIRLRPWWMNLPCYWIATLLGFSWPFRLLFRWKTSKCEYIIRKKIFLSRPDNEVRTPLSAASMSSVKHVDNGMIERVAPLYDAQMRADAYPRNEPPPDYDSSMYHQHNAPAM